MATHPKGMATGADPVRTLIDELIEQQQQLATPVATFSQVHDSGSLPAMEPVYRDLIPLTKPGPGEQYAFEVDLDACSGCKACVAGCHSMNGLDEHETWRDVGLIVGGSREASTYQQTITTACHHCADPECLNGCPVLAYEKDPLTGIVRHLDDQCIGCSYCILKCPYDVPKFNERLGIVRKCDMCHGRLEASEAPACVQACPTQAIRIVKVRLEQSDGRAGCDTKAFLPVAPSAATTRPTTRYLSERGLPSDAVAADHGHHRRQPAHLPLVFLLVLSQLALGLQLAGELGLALILGMAGLAASTLHLGQPLRAWRVFLGLRRSWLSREAVALGLWVPALAGAWAGARWYPESPYTGILVSVAAVLGTIGVLSSAWLYADTPRRAWAARWTFPRFAGTTALGVGALGTTLAVPLLLIVKVGLELLWAQRASPATRALISGELRTVLVFRILTAVAATGLLLASESQPIQALGLVLILLGELLERTLFFVAVDPSAMPGQPAGRA